jgi:hypothetical protein
MQFKVKDTVFYLRNNNHINKSFITRVLPNCYAVDGYSLMIGKERVFKTYKEAQEYQSILERKNSN